jgi:hypothetical protein
VEHVERDVDWQQDIAVRPATIIAIVDDLRSTGAFLACGVPHL